MMKHEESNTIQYPAEIWVAVTSPRGDGLHVSVVFFGGSHRRTFAGVVIKVVEPGHSAVERDQVGRLGPAVLPEQHLYTNKHCLHGDLKMWQGNDYQVNEVSTKFIDSKYT